MAMLARQRRLSTPSGGRGRWSRPLDSYGARTGRRWHSATSPGHFSPGERGSPTWGARGTQAGHDQVTVRWYLVLVTVSGFAWPW